MFQGICLIVNLDFKLYLFQLIIIKLSGPSAISAIWGVILFKEIKGTRNFVLLGCGFALAVAGSILCGISK